MFKEYQGKSVVRMAYEVKEGDSIEALHGEESTSLLLNEVRFKHYEPVNVGDYIVRLTEEDTYHCAKAVFEERNHVNGDKQNKVEFDHVQSMVGSLTFQFARIGETTTTVCEAFLPNGFSVGSGKSACVDPANYKFEDGCKYAKENAIAEAKNTIWQLEGYLLKVTGKTSDSL